MEITIKFTDEEGRRLKWLLRKKYNSKARLLQLAKKAIREVAAIEAKTIVEEIIK